MKIFFLLENYHSFYSNYINDNPESLSQSFIQLKEELFNQYNYQSDSYSYGMRNNGVEVDEMIANCKPLQLKWAEDFSKNNQPSKVLHAPYKWYYTRIKRVPDIEQYWMEQALIEQVAQAKPDVLYVFSGVIYSAEVFRELKKHCKLLVLQWSVPVYISPDYPFDVFDLIVSTSYDAKSSFDELGLKTELLQHCFDDRILDQLEKEIPRDKKVLFIGSLQPTNYFAERIKLLEFLAPRLDFDFYCPEPHLDLLAPDSPVRNKYKGSTFGLDMYQVIRQYDITIHIHGHNNDGAKRLYEAPAMGTLLVADNTAGVHDFYTDGKEIIIYNSPEDCLTKVEQLLHNPDQNKTIAKAGNERLMRDHTITKRMGELAEILKKHVP